MFWRPVFGILALCAVVLSADLGVAQIEDATPTPPQVRKSPLRLVQDEQNIPEIVVQPPEEVVIQPTDPLGISPLNLPSYPSLSQQQLGGFSGGLRNNRSIFDDPRHDTVVGRQQLEEIAPIDLGEALSLESGVFVQRTGRGMAAPYVRGLTGQQVLILVDGIRMTNSTFRAGPNQYFSQIDPNMVERIEVIRGPGSVQWGSDAIGGVINVVTRSATITGYDYLTGGTRQNFSTADLGYQGRLNVEGWIGSTGLFAGAGYGNYNNLDRGGDLGRQPATSFAQYSGDIKLTYQLDRSTQLIASMQHFVQNDLFRTDRYSKGDERIFDPQQRNLAYIRLNGSDVGRWLESYSLTVSYQRIREGQIRHNDNMGNFTTESQREFDNNQFGLNLVGVTDLDQLGRLTYGFDWYHENVTSSRRDIDFTTNPPSASDRDGPFPDGSIYSRFGTFLEWDVRLSERLKAVAGTRYSYIKAGALVTAGSTTGFIDPTYSDVSSSVGLTYELSPSWHLVGSVAEGFRAPNLDDLAATNDDTFAGTQIANPTLRPERSLNYEIGIKADTDRLRGQLFVFWTDIKDHILRQPVGDPLNPNFILQRENRDSQLQGVEAAGEYLLDRGWSLYGNFTYVYGNDVTAGEPLSRVNPTQGITGLRWRSDDGDNWFDTYVHMVRRQSRLAPRDVADTVRIPAGGTPGYMTLNFRYGRMISDRQRITLNLTNVTDRAYRVHGSGSDGAGIGLLLGYEWLH